MEVPARGSREPDFSDFTTDAYRGLVTAAGRSYAFQPFGQPVEGPHVLWRHDVDLSPHRALRMAEIEADAGARATYFLWPHSEFYSLLERSTRDIVRRILSLGHWPGLHFDAGYYGGFESRQDLEVLLDGERTFLAELCEAPIDCFSYHNPDVEGMASFDDDRIAGMVNAYGANLKANYSFVSDSNGYWRHRRLADVIAAADEPRLHVLTHPEWWQEEPMSPRARVERCLDGRRDRAVREYDALLARWGRRNIA